MIDLIIPTVAGREDSLARCIESYERNTAPSMLNVITVKDEPTCGEAWIKGLEQSTAPYVHLSCDDLEQTSRTWAGACVEATDYGKLPCPVVRRPDGTLESCGGDMSAPACLLSDLSGDGTEVDFTVSPFLSRAQVDAIGMIPVHYLSDVWVSYKGRELGYPTVVLHAFQLTHHHSNVKRIAPNIADRKVFDEALNG